MAQAMTEDCPYLRKRRIYRRKGMLPETPWDTAIPRQRLRAATPLSKRGLLGVVNSNAFSYSNGARERTDQKAPLAKELSAKRTEDCLIRATIANCGAVMAQAMTEDCLIHASAGYTPLGKRRIVPAAAVQPFGRAFAWRPIPSPLPGAGRGMKCEGAAPLHRRNTAIPVTAYAVPPHFKKGAFGSGELQRISYSDGIRARTDQKAPFERSCHGASHD